MKCKICFSDNTKVIYKGKIRNGGLGQYTENDIEMHQCTDCGVIWHEDVISDIKKYYESEEYRVSLENSSEESNFYKLHDKETFEKFRYTGTAIWRDKVVADIGCGCGAFLDFLKGVSKKIIAIEPSEKYRSIMQKKGFETFAYSEDAKKIYENAIDVITSFDVIEHVSDPENFLNGVFSLLKQGGQAYIGTPTDAPIMRELLGSIYEKKILYSTQHLWIFSKENLMIMAKKCGFGQVDIKFYQRYSIENMLGWLKEKEANSNMKYNSVLYSLNGVWKSQCEMREMSDYIVLELKK